jgi:hypothetical protein
MTASLAPIRQMASNPRQNVILASGDFFEMLQNPAPALRFVRKQINHPAARPHGIALRNPRKDNIGLRQERRVLNRIKNPQPVARKKAEQFLKGVQKRAKTPPA